MARYQLGRRTIELTVQRSVDPKVAAARVASIHRDAVADAEGAWRSALGNVPSSETWVDGREGVRLESVRLNGGVILTRFEMLGEVVEWVYEQLVVHSPYLEGRYQQSHRVYADGLEVDAYARRPAREYIIASSLIYARKIEKWFSLYSEVADNARRRFGNSAHVRFIFTDVANAEQFGTSRRQRGGSDRFPAIKITLR